MKNEHHQLIFAMRFSVAVGFFMLLLKTGAWAMTGSAAILSDAAESVVHVAAVLFALYSMHFSHKPADRGHAYGHAKIGFFSAGFEGGMILLAAVFIIYESVRRLMIGPELEHVRLGLALTLLATVINGALGGWLLWLGRVRKSLILESNAQHVLTDCWTSLGVVLALVLTIFTGWAYWDPIFGLLVGANILLAARRLLKRSIGGLMDEVETTQREEIVRALDEIVSRGDMDYHELKVRPLGDRQAVEFHLLMRDDLTLDAAHRIATRVEDALRAAISPSPYVTSHIEPIQSHDDAHPTADIMSAHI